MSKREKKEDDRPVWAVRGVDRDTQQAAWLEIQAADEAEARAMASEQGMLVLEVENAAEVRAVAHASFMVRKLAALAVIYWICLISMGYYSVQVGRGPIVRLHGPMAYGFGAALLFLPIPLLRAMHAHEEHGGVDDLLTLLLIVLGFVAIAFLIFAYLYWTCLREAHLGAGHFP